MDDKDVDATDNDAMPDLEAMDNDDAEDVGVDFSLNLSWLVDRYHGTCPHS